MSTAPIEHQRRFANTIRAALCALFALLMLPISAHAEETCRFIDKRAEREACYKRQDETRAAKLKAQEEAAKRAAAYSPSSADDQNMFRTLHSICRGC